MDLPNELSYTKDHEWLLVDGDIGTIGITDYAQSELGDVVYVELPEDESDFSQGDAFGSLESVKAVSEIFMPVDGEIVEVNQDLEDSPELVNDDPYNAGWLVKIRLTDPDQVDELMSSEEYEQYLKEETE
ncbi:MAG TPA: glycine cleavage system protein GcvH [Acidobacteriota bacterium]|nr:glycine cleavage system protein GcvH [Acidobacteriota bacterium]